MASGLTVTIGADSSQLQAQLAVAQSSVRAYTRELNAAASVARKTGDDLAFAKVGQSVAQLNAAKQVVADLSKGMEQAAASGQVLARSVSLNRGGLLELQAAGVNSFQALASGMDVFRVASMEGAQVIGALVQGGLVGFSALVSPLGLIASAALAAGGAIGYMAYQSYQTRQTLSGMNTELLLTGRAGMGSLDDAGKAAEALAQKYDITKRAAAELLAEISKARTLNAEQIKQVAELAAAEGKARRRSGEDITDADIAKKMAAALADGAAGAIKLAQSYNIATAAAEQMLKSGNELGAFRKVLDEIAEHIRTHVGAWSEAKAKADEYQRSLNQIVGAMGELGAAGLAEAERIAGPAPPRPTEKPSGGSGIGGTDGAERMRSWLLANGYSPNAAAAVMGNARIESGFNPAAVGPGGHFGLFQWDQARAAPLAGSTDFDRQMKLMDQELAKRDAGFKSAGGSAADLAARFEKVFEVSGGQMLAQRQAFATQFSGSGTGGGETQFADKAAREKAQQEIEQGYRLSEIANRNSLERQAAEAKAHYDKLAELVRSENPKITDAELAKDSRIEAAQLDLNQKRAALYDQDTGRAVAALREQQAKATEIRDKIRLQQSVIGTLESRGAPITQIDSARTELAALQRQSSQDAIAIEEEKLTRLRSMGQLELQQFTAQEELRVAKGQETREQAVQHEATAADRMLAEQRRGAQGLVDLAETLGLSARQVDKFKDSVKQIDIERVTRQAQASAKEAEAAKALMDKWTEPIKSAFSGIESSISSAVAGLISRKKTFAQAITDIKDSMIGSATSAVGGILSKVAARGLGAPAGEGLAEWAAKKTGEWLFPAAAEATGATEMTAAITLGGTTAATEISAAMTAAGAAAAASIAAAMTAGGAGGGALAGIGGGAAGATLAIAALARGGIVPSAARGMIVPAAAGGWALPASFGTDRTLAALTPGEMVLPRQISQGLQSMMGGNGGNWLNAAQSPSVGPSMHMHFHGPSDAPGIERWSRQNLMRNGDVVNRLARQFVKI